MKSKYKQFVNFIFNLLIIEPKKHFSIRNLLLFQFKGKCNVLKTKNKLNKISRTYFSIFTIYLKRYLVMCTVENCKLINF